MNLWRDLVIFQRSFEKESTLSLKGKTNFKCSYLISGQITKSLNKISCLLVRGRFKEQLEVVVLSPRYSTTCSTPYVADAVPLLSTISINYR